MGALTGWQAVLVPGPGNTGDAAVHCRSQLAGGVEEIAPLAKLRCARCTVQSVEQSMPLAAGTRLGPYERLEQIGAGGMGEAIVLATTRLDRIVAVKVL